MSAADTTTTPVPPPRRHSSPPGHRSGGARGLPRRRNPLGRAAAPWVLLAPCILVLVLVLGYPLFKLVKLSFQDYRKPQLWGFKPAEWVGFDNYRNVLQDGEFWDVVFRTIIFAGVAVAVTMAAGMLVALLLQRVSGWVRTLVNIALVASWAMPVVVAVTVFKWMFDTDYGVVNWTLSQLPGVDFEGHNWFNSGPEGMSVIMLQVVWGAIPFVVITLGAGLTQVPKELEEAARLDGASAPGIFRYVTFPIIKPLVVMMTTLSVIWDMGVFAQVWLIRDGHPEPQFQVLTTYSYQEAFGINDYAKGSAIALLTVLLLVGVVAVYMRQMLKIGEVE